MNQPLNLGPSGEQPAMLKLDYKHGTAQAGQYPRELGRWGPKTFFMGPIGNSNELRKIPPFARGRGRVARPVLKGLERPIEYRDYLVALFGQPYFVSMGISDE